MEQQILAAGQLLTADDSLHRDDQVQGNVLSVPSLKTYENYYVGNPDFALSLVIDAYHRLASVTFYDYKSKLYYENTRHTFSSLGIVRDQENETYYEDGRLKMGFASSNGIHHLIGHFRNFLGSQSLSFDLTLQETTDMSLVLKTPTEKKDVFSYYQTTNNLHAKGTMTFGEKTYDFKDTIGTCHVQRGLFMEKQAKTWASLSYLKGEDYLGFHLNDFSKYSDEKRENVLFHNRLAYWLDGVVFYIEKDNKGQDDYRRPWKIYSPNRDVDLVFTPTILKKLPERALFNSERKWQAIGYYDGIIKTGSQEFKIENALGFAEKANNSN